MRHKELSDIFAPDQSPYIGMYTAGRHGYGVQEVMSYCSSLGLPVREKDVKNWENGHFVWQMCDSRVSAEYDGMNPTSVPMPRSGNALCIRDHGMDIEDTVLEDFARYPEEWHGTEWRFFPCTSANRPKIPWGWRADFTPGLMREVDARVLSPSGWVGQNMLYQRFVVMDIDGAGHGMYDESVVAFGSIFKNRTMTMEDPRKPGSFHLYFKTDRLIPVKHFPWAKLDLMGNAVNAAVYLKDKKSNGLPMAELTDDIWKATMAYQKARKEK